MTTFVTHPSVRVKGTEASFSPVGCSDAVCKIKGFHMHCPFCVKTDSYVDPVILKMHYRVKHVDKGVDFAGLKILRCCERCEIVGAIKGEKTFKGAHWHCYKCRNGFNRRDEAVKHYKTHFRNPETTFQIQISQIDESLHSQSDESRTGDNLITQTHDVTIHPALTEAVMSSSAVSNGIKRGSTSANRRGEREVQVSVAANETVGSSEPQTIMIIQEADIDTGQTMDSSYTVIPNEDYSDDNSAVDSVLEELDIQEKCTQLQQQCRQLEAEKAELKAELQDLQSKYAVQTAQLARCQKHEQEILKQLSVPLDKDMQDLLTQLELSHKELLHHQLAALRRCYVNQQGKEQQTITIPSAALQNAVLGAESGSISITIQRGGLPGDALGEPQEATLAVEQFPLNPEEHSEEFDSQRSKVMHSTDESVVGLACIAIDQQPQLSTSGSYIVANSTVASQVTNLTTSSADSYESHALTAVVDGTELNFSSVPVPSMQVEETSCDIASTEIQASAESPPAKRSKQDART